MPSRDPNYLSKPSETNDVGLDELSLAFQLAIAAPGISLRTFLQYDQKLETWTRHCAEAGVDPDAVGTAEGVAAGVVHLLNARTKVSTIGALLSAVASEHGSEVAAIGRRLVRGAKKLGLAVKSEPHPVWPEAAIRQLAVDALKDPLRHIGLRDAAYIKVAYATMGRSIELKAATTDMLVASADGNRMIWNGNTSTVGKMGGSVSFPRRPGDDLCAVAAIEELLDCYEEMGLPRDGCLFRSFGDSGHVFDMADGKSHIAKTLEIFDRARGLGSWGDNSTRASTHMIRRSATTHAVERGYTIKQLDTALGHQPQSTTLLYIADPNPDCLTEKLPKGWTPPERYTRPKPPEINLTADDYLAGNQRSKLYTDRLEELLEMFDVWLDGRSPTADSATVWMGTLETQGAVTQASRALRDDDLCEIYWDADDIHKIAELGKVLGEGKRTKPPMPLASIWSTVDVLRAVEGLSKPRGSWLLPIAVLCRHHNCTISEIAHRVQEHGLASLADDSDQAPLNVNWAISALADDDLEKLANPVARKDWRKWLQKLSGCREANSMTDAEWADCRLGLVGIWLRWEASRCLLALGFSGLRPEEMKRLLWEDIGADGVLAFTRKEDTSNYEPYPIVLRRRDDALDPMVRLDALARFVGDRTGPVFASSPQNLVLAVSKLLPGDLAGRRLTAVSPFESSVWADHHDPKIHRSKVCQRSGLSEIGVNRLIERHTVLENSIGGDS